MTLPETKIPKQIIIEVTNRCNLKCRYCPATTSKYPVGDMSIAMFKSIVDRVNFKTVLIPWMNGEPLLHPRYTSMVKHVIDRDIPMYITTNGHFWNEELFQLVTEENSCYQLIFSLDGLFDEKFSSIELARPGSDRMVVADTISRFMKLAESKGRNLDIAVKICERGQDYEEIETYISEWLLNGVDYVCVGRTLEWAAPKGMRHYPCQYFNDNFMVIRWDGRIVACAYHDEVVNEGKIPLGRIDPGPPLLELYNSPAYQELRKSHQQGTFPDPCDTCGFAYTGTGMSGVLRMRNPKLDIGDIYYHKDYYNSFYSLKKSWKKDDYYGQAAKSSNS